MSNQLGYAGLTHGGGSEVASGGNETDVRIDESGVSHGARMCHELPSIGPSTFRLGGSACRMGLVGLSHCGSGSLSLSLCSLSVPPPLVRAAFGPVDFPCAVAFPRPSHCALGCFPAATCWPAPFSPLLPAPGCVPPVFAPCGPLASASVGCSLSLVRALSSVCSPPFSVDYLRGVAPRNGCSIAHVLRFLPSSSSHSSSCKVLLRRQVAVGDLGLLNVAVIPSVRHFANESGYGSVVAVTLARFRSPSSVSRSHLGSINLCPTQIIWLSCVGAASRWESKRSSLLPGPLLPRRTVPVSIVFYSDGSSTVSEALPIQDGLVTGVEDGLIIGGGSNIAGQRECGGGVCVWLAAVQESSVSRSASVSIDKVLGGNGKCSSKSHLSCSGLGCVPLRAGII